MRTPATLALLALLASATATADPFERTFTGADRSPAAQLYVQVPLAKRGQHRDAFTFGLRLQQTVDPLRVVGPRTQWQPKTLLDVPLRVRSDDPLAGSHAMMLGKGALIGVICGGVVAVAVLADDNNDGSGGGY